MENETLVRKKTKRRKGKKKKMTEEIKNSENEESESGNEESSESKEKQEHEKENEKKDDELISGRFDLKKNMMLGKGSFGEVYLVQDILTKNFLAMKKEFQKKTPQLKTEKNVLDMMSDYEGFPNVYEYGSHQDWNFMIMELLGPSLSDLYSYCGFKFTLQTILLIAIQMIQRIQDLHNKNFIHRDIKPENFLIGVAEKTNVVHVIDFGLVKKYKDSKTMEHIPYRETRMLTGTARYASINNHLGIEQSRRDDLEAIGYVLLFFFRRRLPWQGVDGSSQNAKYKKILEKKLSISVELLCKDLPLEMSIYMNYVKNLRFDERPDYAFLKGIFTNLLVSTYNEEFTFDWFLEVPILEAPNRKNYDVIIDRMKKSKKNLLMVNEFKRQNTIKNMPKVESGKEELVNLRVEQEKEKLNKDNQEKEQFNFLKKRESETSAGIHERFTLLERNLKVSDHKNEGEIKKHIHSDSFSSLSEEKFGPGGHINNEQEIILEIKNSDETDPDKTLELASDSDRTENNDNFDGNDFIQIVDEFYKKKSYQSYHSKKKHYISPKDSNFSFKSFENDSARAGLDTPSKSKFLNANNKFSSGSLGRTNHLINIEPVLEDPNEEGDFTKQSIKKNK